MRNTIWLLLLGALLASGCKKSKGDNGAATAALDSAQVIFQRTFPGINCYNNCVLQIVSGLPDNFNNAAISATGKVTFGAGNAIPFNNNDSMQLQITSARQEWGTTTDTGWYYELNIWKWSSPNNSVGTGKMGVRSTQNNMGTYSRPYYELDINAAIEQFGTYIDSI